MITHFETTKKAYLANFQKNNESHESSKFKASSKILLCAGDGEAAFKKQSGGLFLAASAQTKFEPDRSDFVTKSLRLGPTWVQVPSTHKKNRCIRICFMCGRWDLNPHDVAITRSLV